MNFKRVYRCIGSMLFVFVCAAYGQTPYVHETFLSITFGYDGTPGNLIITGGGGQLTGPAQSQGGIVEFVSVWCRVPRLMSVTGMNLDTLGLGAPTSPTTGDIIHELAVSKVGIETKSVPPSTDDTVTYQVSQQVKIYVPPGWIVLVEPIFANPDNLDFSKRKFGASCHASISGQNFDPLPAS